MTTNEKSLPLNQPKSILTIVRSREEGPNCQPNWRWLTVQEYLAEIENPAQAATNQATKLKLILGREKDKIVRQTLQFHYDLLNDNHAAVKYALRCASSEEDAWMIKAMIVAKRSTEQIAEELGTQSANVDFFEKLYFDVRCDVDKPVVLRKICFGSNGHRWLQVAFERGWPGVEEVILQRLPKGPRGINHAVSVLLARVQAGLFQLEASNVAPSEKDLQQLLRLAQLNAHGQLPFLEDSFVEEQSIPDSEGTKKFAKLSFGGREKVRAFLTSFMDKAAEKALAKPAQDKAKEAQVVDPETEKPVASQ